MRRLRYGDRSPAVHDALQKVKAQLPAYWSNTEDEADQIWNEVNKTIQKSSMKLTVEFYETYVIHLPSGWTSVYKSDLETKVTSTLNFQTTTVSTSLEITDEE